RAEGAHRDAGPPGAQGGSLPVTPEAGQDFCLGEQGIDGGQLGGEQPDLLGQQLVEQQVGAALKYQHAVSLIAPWSCIIDDVGSGVVDFREDCLETLGDGGDDAISG